MVDKAQFDEVFAQSKRIFSTHFVILYKENALPFSRLGVMLSKKKLRFAVERNRVKRVVREGFRQNQGNCPGVDMVVLAQKACKTATNKELFQCVEQAFEKLRARLKKSV